MQLLGIPATATPHAYVTDDGRPPPPCAGASGAGGGAVGGRARGAGGDGVAASGRPAVRRQGVAGFRAPLAASCAGVVARVPGAQEHRRVSPPTRRCSCGKFWLPSMAGAEAPRNEMRTSTFQESIYIDRARGLGGLHIPRAQQRQFMCRVGVLLFQLVLKKQTLLSARTLQRRPELDSGSLRLARLGEAHHAVYDSTEHAAGALCQPALLGHQTL